MDIASCITFSHTLLSSAFLQPPSTAIASFLSLITPKSREFVISILCNHYPLFVSLFGTYFYVSGVTNNPPSRARIRLKAVLE